MENTSIFISFLSLIFLFVLSCFKLLKKKSKLILPPSPSYWIPIMGHLHLLQPLLHRFFHSLSQKLGPIFSLRFGNRLVYVVCSSSIAEECFTKNDVVLANRPHLYFGKHVGYNYSNMVNTSYGTVWRNLRRISILEILSTNRINSFLTIRSDEIRRVIKRLSRDSTRSFARVDMKSTLFDLTFNNIVIMIAGKRYFGDDLNDEKEASQVRDLLAETILNAGAGNAGDYSSILNFFSGHEKKMKDLGRRLDIFIQGLIDEHRSKKEKGNSMIDLMLTLQTTQPEFYTDEIIKGLMQVLIIAGTETSAITLEWALSNLLNHPDVLTKAKAEIDSVIGQDRLIQESDISNLPYLQNVVHETFRLNPAAPLLIPHSASKDCVLAGYDMTKDTILLVNSWAIHRDPTLWEDPTTFKPERFDKEGAPQKIMPFGLGRRSCPGAGLAQRIVGLTLGSLIQCYEWERVSKDKVDMTEGEGLTMPKAQALHALCKTRPIMTKVLAGIA